jgi:hypothetical protein
MQTLLFCSFFSQAFDKKVDLVDWRMVVERRDAVTTSLQ